MLKIKKIFVQNEEPECGDINLVLGANNTGKSTFIKELLSGTQNARIQPNNFWIKKIKINVSNIKNEFENLFPGILDLNSFDLVGDINKNGVGVIYSTGGWNCQTYDFIRDRGNSNFDYEISDLQAITQGYIFIGQLKTLQEGCNERLNPQLTTTISKLDGPYQNLVHYLYANPLLFKKISLYIKKTFGIEIVFDDIIQGQKDIRIKPSIKTLVNRKTNPLKYSEYWQKNSELLSTQGDGIKAYLKICFSLFNPSKDVIFIDEPETFLHSPQRRSLGNFISENADNGKQLFIATHDSEILRGILLSSDKNIKNIKIFYLKDYGENRKCHYLDVKNLSNKSRQYNEHVLNGFFNKLTVLCEAEDDRNIYQYAAQKYLPVDSVDVQFVGLNGKGETINNLVLLRKSGINACCIFDIDALYSNEILHDDLQLSQGVKVKIQSFQANLKKLLKIDQTDKANEGLHREFKSKFKRQGVNYPLLSGIKVDMIDCINELEKMGVFIIEVGHLESWLGLNKRDDKKLQKAINIMNATRKIKLKKFLKKAIGFKIH